MRNRVALISAATVLALGVVACGSSSSSTSSTATTIAASLPSGAWGKLVGCLQGHPTFSVSTAGTGGVVTAKTSAVVVLSQASGKTIAYVGDLNAGADGVTGTEGMNVDQIAGPVQYGYSTTASHSAVAAVAACVASSGIGVGACAHVSLKGVSCEVAQEVMAEYEKTTGTTSNGVIQKTFTVQAQQVTCKELSGTVACQVGSGQIAFNPKS